MACLFRCCYFMIRVDLRNLLAKLLLCLNNFLNAILALFMLMASIISYGCLNFNAFNRYDVIWCTRKYRFSAHMIRWAYHQFLLCFMLLTLWTLYNIASFTSYTITKCCFDFSTRWRCNLHTLIYDKPVFKVLCCKANRKISNVETNL